MHPNNLTLQSLLEASPLAIIALDQDFNVMTWNPAAESMFGWNAREVLGRRYPLVPDARWHEVLTTIQRFKDGVCLDREERVREHKTGRLVDVNVSTAPLHSEAGEVSGFLAIIADITERKRAEEELRFTNAILRTQQETSPDGILVVDDAGMIVSFNKRFSDMSGISVEMLGAKYDGPVLNAVTHLMADPAEFLARVRYLYEHREESARDELLLRDGRTVERYSAPMVAPDGKYYGRVWYFRDISERKRTEKERAAFLEQLHQAQKMDALGQLAGGVAHDFHNLLTVILGNLDLLQRLLPENQTVDEVSAMIRDAAEQAVGVTRSLLTFSRRLPPEKKRVDLQQVVVHATRMLCRILPAGIQVVVNPSSKSAIWVEADPVQLEQVLLNLAINARDAMPDGGTLAISVCLRSPGANDGADPFTASEPFACVSVSDTGEGIPESVRARIFEPFFSTKPRDEGTGLGLAIVHGIVDDHNGRIELDTQVGRGSTFRVCLPVVQPDTVSASRSGPMPAPCGQQETILLAEDNAFVRETIVSMLGRLNYKVVTVADGESLMNLWHSQRQDIDLLVLDVELPAKRGIDCLRIIRESGAAVPAILITGFVAPEVEDEIDERTLLLAKPFDANQLGILVGRILASARRGGGQDA